MKNIVRHGTNVPTLGDLSEGQLGYCISDSSLYIKSGSVIHKIDDSILDSEMSRCAMSSGTDGGGKTSLGPIKIDASGKVSLYVCYNDNDKQVSFKIVNTLSEAFTVHNVKIFLFDKLAPSSTEISEPEDIVIESGDTAEYVCSDLSSSEKKLHYMGLAKFDTLNIHIDIDVDSSAKLSTENISVSYGALEGFDR